MVIPRRGVERMLIHVPIVKFALLFPVRHPHTGVEGALIDIDQTDGQNVTQYISPAAPLSPHS